MNHSMSNPCIYCGDPGYLLAIAPDYPSAAVLDADATALAKGPELRSVASCKRHEAIVRSYGERLYQPIRMAYRDGRPSPPADSAAEDAPE